MSVMCVPATHIGNQALPPKKITAAPQQEDTKQTDSIVQLFDPTSAHCFTVAVFVFNHL